LLSGTWTLEDVDDVEGLVSAVIDLYLHRRGAYLRSDQRDELHAYLLGETWRLYVKYNPAKAGGNLSLSTFLFRRLGWATTNWYREYFGDSRYKRPDDELPLVLDLTVDTDLEPSHEDVISKLPSLSDTGRGRWEKFGLLRAAGYTYAEIAERTGTATGEIGAEIEALRHELGKPV
jgi:hypothetical protein